MTAPYWLDPYDDSSPFPPVELALRDPDGLLAIGGDLSVRRLTRAYSTGIFPWYSEDQPILWWSPDPRAVLFPQQLRVSRSLRKTLRRRSFTVSLDQSFGAVLRTCAAPRQRGGGTWITPAMIEAYDRLYEAGYGHSVEVWEGRRLVGGLYGVALGRVFFGESMFSHRPNASKVALVHLVRQLTNWNFGMIDCQVRSAHLTSLGAVDVHRREFMALLHRWCQLPGRRGRWRFETDWSETAVEAVAAQVGGD